MALTLATNETSRATLWTSWILSGLTGAFLLMDGAMKVIQPEPVREASARLGMSGGSVTTVGIVLIASTLLYLIPRTAVLGAVLLTGFLGGAIAAQLHAGSAPFELLFPLIPAVMAWGGLLMRDSRLASVFPLAQLK